MDTKERRYEVRMNPGMDDCVKQLAHDIDGDITDVFNRAMRLYYEVKTRQLKQNVRVLLEDSNGTQTEIINV